MRGALRIVGAIERRLLRWLLARERGRVERETLDGAFDYDASGTLDAIVAVREHLGDQHKNPEIRPSTNHRRAARFFRKR